VRLAVGRLQTLTHTAEPCRTLHAVLLLLLLHLPFPHLDQLLLLLRMCQHAVQLLLVGVLQQTLLHSVSQRTRQLLLLLSEMRLVLLLLLLLLSCLHTGVI
jgi:hypothetical protein